MNSVNVRCEMLDAQEKSLGQSHIQERCENSVNVRHLTSHNHAVLTALLIVRLVQRLAQTISHLTSHNHVVAWS